MRILLIADFHGYSDDVSKFFKKIDASEFDLIICPGDFTDVFSQPPGFTQGNIANLMIQKLVSFGVPTLCVPGNHDPPEILDIFDEYGVNLHGKVKEFKNETFMGLGGCSVSFNLPFELRDEEIEDALNEMGNKVKKGDFILVVHNPPKNTKLDRIASGEHVGSQVFRNFIEKMQPKLVLSAHIHESSGTDKIGNSVLFYPGPFFTGHYGIIKIKGKQIECEVKKVSLD